MDSEQTQTRIIQHQGRSREIDVYRGLAALVVVLGHYIPFWHDKFQSIPVIVPGSLGYYSVKLFFVISGFVIFMTLEKCETVRDFAVLRFSRLYPIYWSTLLLSVMLGYLLFEDRSLWAAGLLTNLTMFQEFLGYPNIDNVYWSLTVELAFYINVAILFALGYHRKTKLCILLWLIASCIWAVTSHEPGVRNDRNWAAIFLALDYAPYFSMGIVLYEVTRTSWSLSWVALIVFALVTESLIASWEGMIVGPTVFLLMYIATHVRIGGLANPITLWLGSISYALYLIHRNTGYSMLSWAHQNGYGPLVSIVVSTIVALVLATLFTYYIEKPASRKIRVTYEKWKRIQSPVA